MTILKQHCATSYTQLCKYINVSDVSEPFFVVIIVWRCLFYFERNTGFNIHPLLRTARLNPMRMRDTSRDAKSAGMTVNVVEKKEIHYPKCTSI